MDIQSLLNDTMGLLREAIMNQAQQTVEIEKELSRLKAEFENIKENQRIVFRKLDSLIAIQETVKNLTVDYREQRKDITGLSLTVAKKIGEITAIIAIIYAILQYTGR